MARYHEATSTRANLLGVDLCVAHGATLSVQIMAMSGVFRNAISLVPQR